MANKQLTAKVRLNTSQAEKAIDNLINKINQLNKAVNSVSNDNFEKKFDRATKKASKVAQTMSSVENSTALAVRQTSSLATQVQRVANNSNVIEAEWREISSRLTAGQRILNGIYSIKYKLKSTVTNINTKVKEWWSNQLKVNSATRSASAVLGSIWSRLKGIAATYLGIMGGRALINTSDTITSAENRLNALNGGDTQATQESLDKMYVSAQKVRMAYTDMIANASKSMTLAGDAFQGNMDNAIRFQEIMAEAYGLGGASAAEMSSSMYQMIQALGSGTLAGDELRSVREGAPLAYKAIEEFAQGVFDTEESLKELASQGKITSEMVVAAVMSAGDKMDAEFAKTKQTFAQTWEQIKNIAVKAFEPVSKMMRKALNDAVDNGLIEKMEKIFVSISKALQITFQVIYNSIVWIADNWNWLKHVLIGGLILYASYLIITTAVAIGQALLRIAMWLYEYWAVFLIISAILALIYVFYLWKTAAIDTCTAIALALILIGVIVTIIGILIGNWIVIIVGLVLMAIGLIMMYFAEFCGYVNIVIQAIVNAWFWFCNLMIGIWNWCMALLGNILKWFGNLFFGCVNWLSALWNNFIAGCVNVATGLGNVIGAVCQNISIAFQNAFNGALAAFWDFIAGCVEGLDWLAKPLSSIAELFGKSFSYEDFSASLRSKADAYAGKQKDYVSIGDAWSSGMSTMSYESLDDAWSSGYSTYSYDNLGDAWSSGWNTYDTFEKGWADDAYNSGYDWGKGIEDSINQWGSKFQNKLKSGDDTTSWLDNLGKSLGLDFSGTGFPDASDPANNAGNAYKSPSADDLLKGVDGINDNTGKIADSMDLTEEDLQFLRDVANMEWKREYTTANITVDMSNYNTINGDTDLDGLVTKLSDKLYEEMDYLANGVY